MARVNELDRALAAMDAKIAAMRDARQVLLDTRTALGKAKPARTRKSAPDVICPEN